jgi:hypothetical protein
MAAGNSHPSKVGRSAAVSTDRDNLHIGPTGQEQAEFRANLPIGAEYGESRQRIHGPDFNSCSTIAVVSIELSADTVDSTPRLIPARNACHSR